MVAGHTIREFDGGIEVNITTGGLSFSDSVDIDRIKQIERSVIKNSEGSRESVAYPVGTPNPERIRYWVDAPLHHYLFESSDYRFDQQVKKRALLWAAIISHTGIREQHQNPEVIPVSVAKHGKPYIAAYLYAVHQFTTDEIGDELELTRQTVDQYYTDVIAGRR